MQAAENPQAPENPRNMLLSIDESRHALAVVPHTGEAYAMPEFTLGKLEALAAIEAGDAPRYRRAIVPAELVAHASTHVGEVERRPWHRLERRRYLRPAAPIATASPPTPEDAPAFVVEGGRLLCYGQVISPEATLSLWRLVLCGHDIRPWSRALRILVDNNAVDPLSGASVPNVERPSRILTQLLYWIDREEEEALPAYQRGRAALLRLVSGDRVSVSVGADYKHTLSNSPRHLLHDGEAGHYNREATMSLADYAKRIVAGWTVRRTTDARDDPRCMLLSEEGEVLASVEDGADEEWERKLTQGIHV